MLTDKEIITDRKTTTQANGFIMIPACALNLVAAGKVSGAAMTTLVGITSFVKASDRTAMPYLETVAARTGQSTRTVSRHLAQLAEARLVRTYKTMRGPSIFEVVDPCGSCFEHAKKPRKTAKAKMPVMAGQVRQERHDPKTDMAPTHDKFGMLYKEPNPSDQILLTENTETDEIEAHRRIDEQVDRAIDEGKVKSPNAYRKAAHANPDDVAAHGTEIRRQRQTQAVEEAKANCNQCDETGLVWTDQTNEIVPRDHPGDITGHRCHHGAEVPA